MQKKLKSAMEEDNQKKASVSAQKLVKTKHR